MLDDIVDSLKIVIVIAAIGLWVYILTTISNLISALNIFPDIAVGLVYMLLVAVGSLIIILKLKDVQ